MEHINKDFIGWFTYERLYKDMINKFPSGSIMIEVGVYHGRSLSFLIIEGINSGKEFDFVGVDSFTFENQLQQFTENMQPIIDRFNVIIDQSWDAANEFDDNSVDYIHIDCDHVYESVKKDINAWWTKLKVGGIMSGHDYLCVEHPGVEKAVHEFFGQENICTDYVDELCWLIEKK